MGAMAMVCRQALLASSLLVAAACSGDKQAVRASSAAGPASDSSDGIVAAQIQPPSPADSVADTTNAPPDTGRKRIARRAKDAPDSAILLAVATQPKSRTKADSI